MLVFAKILAKNSLSYIMINYLRYLPRTKKLIKYNLKNPIFTELKMWLKVNSNNE